MNRPGRLPSPLAPGDGDRPCGRTIAGRRADTKGLWTEPAAASALVLDFACLLQGGQRREGMSRRIGGDGRRRERDTVLARIRIDSKDQELGCERAEVDGAIQQRLGRIVACEAAGNGLIVV